MSDGTMMLESIKDRISLNLKDAFNSQIDVLKYPQKLINQRKQLERKKEASEVCSLASIKKQLSFVNQAGLKASVVDSPLLKKAQTTLHKERGTLSRKRLRSAKSSIENHEPKVE